MYKVASDRRQRSLHHGRPADWVNGAETLAPNDKLKQLQDGIKILQARIDATSGKELAALGQEKLAMQNDIAALRKQIGRPALEWKPFFVNEAKRILSESQFDLIYRSALRECELAQKRRAAESQ